MRPLSRRSFLALATAVSAASATAGKLSPQDDEFLEDLSRRAFQFFWDQSNPHTGLVLDRVRSDGTAIRGRNLEASSTALTGFYLTALCIAFERRWKDPNAIRERVRESIRHLANNQENVRGWYYHFVDRNDGNRIWNCELSTIDTALLLAGVITAQEYFQDDAEIYNLASGIYARIDFPWITDSRTGMIRMGWFPERGFLRAEWSQYRENAILNLLAIASPTYPLPAKSWYLFTRDPVQVAGYRYLGGGPIFTHQYSQAWLYLVNKVDGPPYQIDYFHNSVLATYALRAFCTSLRGIYPSFSDNCWGVTPSDSDIGYIAWGSPNTRRELDGTVVPCAAGGSLMFAPEISVPALRFMRDEFGDYIYGPYGFADSFHPLTGWVNPDVVGLDVGITLMSAENLRTGNIWRWFNRSPDIQRGMQQIFEPSSASVDT